MGNKVLAGTAVQVLVAGQATGLFTSSSDLAAQISTTLTNSGVLVKAITVQTPNEVSALVTGQWYTFEYQATLVVALNYDSTTDDIETLVANGVNAALGQAPTNLSSSTLSPTETSAAVVLPPSSSWWDSFTNWVSSGFGVGPSVNAIGAAAQKDFQLVLLGLVLILVLIVVVVGPHVNLAV